VSGPACDFVGGGPMHGLSWHRPFFGSLTPARIAFALNPHTATHGTLVHLYESAHDGAPWVYQGQEPWDRRTELRDLAPSLEPRGALP
jgi:hypothetical protein